MERGHRQGVKQDFLLRDLSLRSGFGAARKVRVEMNIEEHQVMRVGGPSAPSFTLVGPVRAFSSQE